MGSSHAAPDEAVRSRSNSAHASELLHAAAAGKSTLVRQLLEEAAMIGRLSEMSFERSCSAALFIASQNGHSEVVSALLAHGVNANTAARNGVTPLFVAARNGHREVVGLLLAFTPTDLMGPSLIAAAQQGHDVCVRLILQAGAPADFMQENRVSALWIASQSGKVSVARELLDASADANQRAAEDMPPLFVACQYGHVAVVQLLIARGARVDLVLENGRSPLSVACQRAVQVRIISPALGVVLTWRCLDVIALQSSEFQTEHLWSFLAVTQARLSSSLLGEDFESDSNLEEYKGENETSLAKLLLAAGAPVASGESGDLTRGGLAALNLACSRRDQAMLGLLHTLSAGHANAEQTILDIWEMRCDQAADVDEHDDDDDDDESDDEMDATGVVKYHGSQGLERDTTVGACQAHDDTPTKGEQTVGTQADAADQALKELRRQRQRLKEKARKAQQQRRRQLAASRAELRLAHGRARGEAADALRAAIALHALTSAEGCHALKEAIDAAEKIVKEMPEAALQGMRSDSLIAQAKARLSAMESNEALQRDSAEEDSEELTVEREVRRHVHEALEASDDEMDDATYEALRQEMEALRQNGANGAALPAASGNQVIKTLCEKLSEKLDESIRRRAGGSSDEVWVMPSTKHPHTGAAHLTSEDMSCCICMAAPRNASIVHGETAHICCCIACAKRLNARGHVCPICSEPIDAVLRNFVS
ncbi:MAG: hypothetical protein SGPRY_001069 [Prymnesium sp.]